MIIKNLRNLIVVLPDKENCQKYIALQYAVEPITVRRGNGGKAS
jgi:hypothetical protein